MKNLKHNGIFLMILASLCFSIMGALVKYSMQQLPFMEAVFFRTFVMLVVLLPWMLYKKIPIIPKNKGLMLLRVSSGFLALSLNFYITNLMHLADVSILNQTSVLFVALLSALFLKEKIGLKLIYYIFISLLGAALIIKPEFNVSLWPGFLGLVSGFFAAVAYVSIKKLHDSDHFFSMVFCFAVFGSAFSLLSHFWNPFLMPQNFEWLALIGAGLIATIAQLLLTYAYKNGEASIISPYSFSTVLFSALWGIIFWKEIPDVWSILGAVLIIGCGIGILKIKRNDKPL